MQLLKKVAFVLVIFGMASIASAQGGGGGNGGGNTGGGGQGGQGGVDTGGFNNGGFDTGGNIDPNAFNTGDQTGNTGTGGNSITGEVQDLEDVGETIEDQRAENGFIGPTQDSILNETNFVGPTQSVVGGGQNNGRNNVGGGGFGGGFGLTGQNGYFIQRSSVRARVRPNFSFNAVPSEVVAQRFQDRITRLPVRQSATGIQVQMEGTTATVSGTASTQADLDNVLGQLRMEPGVYRINNQVKVSAQNPGRSGFSSSNN